MNQSIGMIISTNRQNRNMTQEEFAAKLGVTAQAVSRWERGLGMPDIALLEGICKILGISADILLGTDNKIVENNDFVMEKEIKHNMFAEPLVVEFGIGLVECMGNGLKTDLVNKKRAELIKETGILIPVLRIRDNNKLAEQEVRILSYDKELWKQEFPTVEENTYELVIQQVVNVCRHQYSTIINKQMVKMLIDNLKEQYPGIADDLVPERISYLQLQKKLQTVLDEKGNIRDMIHILEEMELGL